MKNIVTIVAAIAALTVAACNSAPNTDTANSSGGDREVGDRQQEK